MREGKRKGLICGLRKELPLFVRFCLLVFLALLARPYGTVSVSAQTVGVICAHGGPVVGKSTGPTDDGTGGADCPHCFLCRGHTTSDVGLPLAPPPAPLVPQHDGSPLKRTASAELPDDPFLLRPPARAPPLLIA